MFHPPRGLVLVAAATLLFHPAFADNASDRQSILSEIDSNLGYAASELSGAKSDSDDGDLRDAESYVAKVSDLVGRLSGVKDDDGRANDVVRNFPGYVDSFRRANGALRSMKGYQNSNVAVAKACENKDTELKELARGFERNSDPEGLEKLPRIASDFKNLTTRFMEEADKFRGQMEDWRKTVLYFSVDDGKWRDVRSELHRDADEINDAFKADHDRARTLCKDLMAGADHPVVKEVLGKLASSSAGRKEVMDNLGRLVGELASKVNDVRGASGTYGVDNVREKLDAIDASLAILERTRGADPKARVVSESWPAIARAARVSIDPLRELKLHHHDMDELPGRCKDLEARLDSAIASNGEDAEGIDKLPAFAIELGNPVMVGLAKAKERLYQMARDRDGVQRFGSSEGPWSGVTSAYKDVSARIYDEFEDHYEDTLSACQYLAKGDEHPKVKTAIDRLRASSGTAIDVLARDVNAWVALAKETYRLDCDAMAKMWEAYCELDWEPTEDPDKSTAERTAASLKDDMQAKMGPLLARMPDLVTRAKALSRRRETKDRAASLLSDIGKEQERLERMFPSQVWRGVNDPLKFYAAEWGKQQHRRMAASFSCDVDDKLFDGKRPDCVKSEGCIILEFKSKDPSAETEGSRQLAEYLPRVADYYEQHLARGTDPDGDHGGAAIMKAFVARGCFKNRRLELKTKVEPYEMCARQYKCVEN